MKKVLYLAAGLAFLSAVFAGCAGMNRTMRENPKTTIGAGTGVLGGAVVGGIVGGRRGALLGGLLGGLAGGAVGHYLDEQEKGLEQTRRDYAYSPRQGIRLKIEAVRANPTVLGPGETVNVNMTYAVLAPSADRQVLVHETREILMNGAVVGRTSIDISRDGGTWRSTVPLTLPATAAPGRYRVFASVETAGGVKDIEETSFRVTP